MPKEMKSGYLYIFPPTDGDTLLYYGDVAIYVKEKRIGAGSFYMSKKAIVWISDESSEAFEINYDEIKCHYPDTSYETSTFPEPNVYLLVDANKNDIGSIDFVAYKKDGTVVSQGSDSGFTGVRIVPSSADAARQVDMVITEAESGCIIL